jgi:transcriptional regulator with XRE-family HTH domain
MITEKLLKDRRLELKMSQRQLARISGVNYTQINKYEKGKAIPSEETLQKICKSLRLPLEYFSRNNEISEQLFLKKVDFLRTQLFSPEERKMIYYFIDYIESQKRIS